MQLSDPKLLRSQCYVNGQWLDAADGRSTPVLNPATGATLGTVPQLDGAATRRAIDAAATAFPAWAAQTAKQRAVILRRWFELMMANQKDLAQLMTAEQGKPLAEASGEIAYAAAFVEWFGEEARRIYGEVIPGHQADKRIVVLAPARRRGGGDHALELSGRHDHAQGRTGARPRAAPFIVKPAGQTPLSALAMAELADRAGVPPGVFNVITGSARRNRRRAYQQPHRAQAQLYGLDGSGSRADGGSPPDAEETVDGTGRQCAVHRVCGRRPRRGGEGAVMASKYRNTGQTCVCANRLLVQNEIYDEFAARLLRAVSALKVGDGLKGPDDLGPLIDAAALAKVQEHVADARQRRQDHARRQAARARGHFL